MGIYGLKRITSANLKTSLSLKGLTSTWQVLSKMYAIFYQKGWRMEILHKFSLVTTPCGAWEAFNHPASGCTGTGDVLRLPHIRESQTKSGIEIKRQIQHLRKETMVCSLSPPAQSELNIAAARPHTVSGTSPSNQSCCNTLLKKEKRILLHIHKKNQLTCSAVTFLLLYIKWF